MTGGNGTTMEPLEYLEHIATAFIASPDWLCMRGEEGDALHEVLVAACERLGFDPDEVIEGVLARAGQVRVAEASR